MSIAITRWIAFAAVLTFAAGCASKKPKETAVRSLTPEQMWATNEEAADLIEDEKFEQAETKLQSVLASDVTFGPAQNNLGLVYYHTGKYYQAAWRFDYAARLMPHQPEPKNNLGMVFEKVGRFDDAVTRYEDARQMQPDNPQFIGNLARARARRGDRDTQTLDLLREVVLKDDRDTWRNWAQEKLAVWDIQRWEQLDASPLTDTPSNLPPAIP